MGTGRTLALTPPMALLVGGAIQVDEGLIDSSLIQDVHAHQGLGDLGVHIGHRLLHALAQVAALVAVPQLAGLVDAGGGAGGHRSAAHGAVLQVDLHLHGGVAPGVQDLPAEDVHDFDDLLHCLFSFQTLPHFQTVRSPPVASPVGAAVRPGPPPADRSVHFLVSARITCSGGRRPAATGQKALSSQSGPPRPSPQAFSGAPRDQSRGDPVFHLPGECDPPGSKGSAAAEPLGRRNAGRLSAVMGRKALS